MRKACMQTKGFISTCDVEKPVSRHSNVSDDGKELDVALIQRLILAAKSEDATERSF